MGSETWLSPDEVAELTARMRWMALRTSVAGIGRLRPSSGFRYRATARRGVGGFLLPMPR